MKTFDAWKLDEAGNVALLFAVSLTVLLGCAGGAVDYARAVDRKSRLTAAADAAALAAATAIEGDRIAIATNYFKNNRLQSVTPVVQVSGDSVRVTASEMVPTTLLQVVGIDAFPVTVEAEAVVGSGQAAAKCILLLEPAKIGLFANMSSGLDADCGVRINSANKEALYVNSGSTLAAASFRVHGQSTINGGSVTPAPVDGSAMQADPLANLAEPGEAGAGCDFTDFTVNTGETRTMTPGVYCKKTIVNSGGTAVMEPGIYVFRGGAFEINSASQVTGSQVMMFFADKDAYLKVNSDSEFQVSAPVSGTYAGLLMFQGRSPENAGAPTFIVNSDSTAKLEGTIYLPLGTLEVNSLSGANQTAAYTAIVARNMVLNSAALLSVRSDFDGPTPLPAMLSSFRVSRVARLTK